MASLLHRARTPEAAFERLYERHAANVYRYTLAMLGERADAEDVTQTTFLNAYRAFQRGERPDKPENWLITIAHNLCRQRFRQQQRRPSEVEFIDEIGGAPEPDDGPSAGDLKRAFAALPTSQREALVMRELEGRSYAEIAEALAISTSALETLLFRARRALREQLDERLTCSEAAFAISKQADGRLTDEEAGALRAHVRVCVDCATLAKRERATRRALKGLLLVPLPQSLGSFIGAGSGVAASAAGAGATGIALKAAAVLTAGAVIGGGTYVGVVEHPRAHHEPRPLVQTRSSIEPRGGTVSPVVSSGPAAATPSRAHKPVHRAGKQPTQKHARGHSAVTRLRHHGKADRPDKAAHAPRTRPTHAKKRHHTRPMARVKTKGVVRVK